MENEKYLRLLARQYPTIESAGTEVINLQAILNLPKGTEHFVSDIHGEYDAFRHVLRNASGVIKDLISTVFADSLRESEKKELATLIYYPERKLALIERTEPDLNDWYRVILNRLIKVTKAASRKYTRSKVRKALPPRHAYILEELITENDHPADKQRYYDKIIETIIRIDQAGDFIVDFAHLIQRLAIYNLHVIGDIFDRGRGSAKIMDMLCRYHAVDVQWGNHDISWMGAAAGCEALICNVIRIAARYGTLDTLEEAYGINLVPLATFAMEKYKHDPCSAFRPDPGPGVELSEKESDLIAKMHKAIAILQFKCESAIIRRHPEFGMQDRDLLAGLDLTAGCVTVEGKVYPLLDTNFPTCDPADPSALSPEETELLEKLSVSFRKNEKLQTHVRFLFTNGSLYTVSNKNLLYHGAIPLAEDGTLKEVSFRGETLRGKALLDAIDRTVREGYFNTFDYPEKQNCLDLTWQLWCGEDSPLFGKKKMATFERYFIADKETHREDRTPYYRWRDDQSVCEMILADFGLTGPEAHIINGHVPVEMTKGEKPVKAGGKLFVIDGGFAKAYQKVTGIAGYTLIYNSHGLVLVSHEPFVSVEAAVAEEKDILSSTVEFQHSANRITVSETDTGRKLKQNVADLEALLEAYHKGLIKESR